MEVNQFNIYSQWSWREETPGLLRRDQQTPGDD